MAQNSKLFKKIAGLAVTGGLAMVTHGSSNVALALFNNITSGMAGNYIQGLDYKKIQGLFGGNNPENLNHDIKKLIIKAVEWSIKNIEFIYKQRVFLEKNQLKELKSFTKELVKETKSLEYKLLNEADSFYQDIENPKGQDYLINKFDIPINEFPLINANHSYGSFFKEEFNEMLQLCFGELLKKQENRNALIAYQRNVYQTLDYKLNQILEQNKVVLTKVGTTSENHQVKSFNKALKDAKLKIKAQNIDDLLPEFEVRINEHYAAFSKELDSLKSVFYKILADINSSYFSKNKVYILSIFVAGIIAICCLTMYIAFMPFTTSISLTTEKSIKVNKLYPELGKYKNSFLEIHVDGEIESQEIDSKNKVVFTNLIASSDGKKIRARLIDNFWKLAQDSVVLRKYAMVVDIVPNESLSLIVGEVFNQDGGSPLSDVEIRSEGTSLTTTNDEGLFKIEMPIEKRKEFYKLDIIKNGYLPNPYSIVYYPQSTFPPIGLIPEKKSK